MAVDARAWAAGEGYLLTGHKSVVSHASSADLLLVSARLAAAGEPGALAVFAVPQGAAGMRQLPYTTVDAIPASEVRLDQVFVPAAAMLGAGSGTDTALEEILDFGLAAICAEAVGALDRLLAATVEYARNRKQFGVPIGKFQALQHRMADMVLHIEQARSMSYLAAVRCCEPDPLLRRRAMSAAKVVVGQAAASSASRQCSCMAAWG